MSSQKLVLFYSYIKCGNYGTLFWHFPKLLRATSQFEAQKMKSPDWCTHPGFCRIPQPSKWEIDLRSSLHKPVGVAVTCAKTHNKFIKLPSTLYPETTSKIWSLHKFFCCFFFSSKTTPSERSNVTSPSYTNIILHIC